MNKKTHSYPSVLTIAGFDGVGGAGIQGDIKTISALGCYATSVLTALPVQNTRGVQSVYPIPADVVEAQLRAVLDDVFPDAIKIGMVHTTAIVHSIVNTLQRYPKVPVVFDPVMVSTSGHRLLEDSTIAVIVKKLFPLAAVITPNLDEAAVLTGVSIHTVDDMQAAGKKIIELGARSVLLKGGHLNAIKLTSLYFTGDGQIQEFSFEKIDTPNTRGTGCTLSSAIVSYIARGSSLSDAVALAQEYVHQAILNGKDARVGRGNGPLNHFFDPQKLIINS
ncbi:bifunctional hydroxymethylpyrimidine kinase/phosphomethylpyrimidine kinase [Mucilaginibacter sp. SG564]|uniref:bifunctional hydroxymethylpyrimidine kinase/phosphomethylpyrimidine kinase n=1 Tax=Mucilaginibacter sp. SG564 TaxID=2587022 RepID=UPI0015530F21|nr:bifunctional hydroxymethylpyrimidine kinase/phosphomethylpyrimidine kinase [Mucilaginibacter sp. SG564]NOW97131.1 hydroxymethylpyrimidine/phosphomethylpyrimidine kinase [Mucilaginibacter sp. SG564]